MKKADKPKVNIFRRIAWMLFAVYAVYQFAILYYPFANGSLSTVTLAFMTEILFGFGAAVYAVWLAAGVNELLTRRQQKGLLVAALMVILFDFITVTSQIHYININLTQMFSTSGENELPAFILLLGRQFLLILAAFFATTNPVGFGEYEEPALDDLILEDPLEDELFEAAYDDFEEDEEAAEKAEKAGKKPAAKKPAATAAKTGAAKNSASKSAGGAKQAPKPPAKNNRRGKAAGG